MTPAEYAGLYEQEETLWWFVGMRRLVDDLLQPYRRPGLRCLDAGCGAGFNALHMACAYDWQVFACDYSEHARHFSKLRGVSRLAGADITRLPYADGSFDVVASYDVIVMLTADCVTEALHEFRRVLRPGGLLIVRTAAMESLRGNHAALNAELHRYTLAELNDVVQSAGFAVKRSTYANVLLAPVTFLKRRVLEPLHLVDAGSDVRGVPDWMNRAFLAAMELDRKFTRMGMQAPFGSSAITVAVRQ